MQRTVQIYGPDATMTYAGPLTPYDVETLIAFTRRRGSKGGISILVTDEAGSSPGSDGERLLGLLRASGCTVSNVGRREHANRPQRTVSSHD